MAPAAAIRLSIASQIRLIDLVHEAAEKVAKVAGFGEDDALNLGLAVREAVINAIVHGNASDPEKTVDVTLVVNGSGVVARVRDQGEGFDPDQAPDPTSDRNRLKTSGRGLLLMRAFVDEVAFRHRKGRGMEVTMTKKAPDGGRSERVGNETKDRRR